MTAAPRKGYRYRQLRKRVQRRDRTCWICGQLIDPRVAWPDAASFSVDHVEPVMLRPELAMDMSNVRGAHLGCNRRRGTGNGDGGHTPQSQRW